MADGTDEQEAALSVYSLVSANLVNTCRNIEPTNPKSHTSLCWAVRPKGSIQATHKQATQHLISTSHIIKIVFYFRNYLNTQSYTYNISPIQASIQVILVSNFL